MSSSIVIQYTRRDYIVNSAVLVRLRRAFSWFACRSATVRLDLFLVVAAVRWRVPVLFPREVR